MRFLNIILYNTDIFMQIFLTKKIGFKIILRPLYKKKKRQFRNFIIIYVLVSLRKSEQSIFSLYYSA